MTENYKFGNNVREIGLQVVASLELSTKVREDFTITEKALVVTFSVIVKLQTLQRFV